MFSIPHNFSTFHSICAHMQVSSGNVEVLLSLLVFIFHLLFDSTPLTHHRRITAKTKNIQKLNSKRPRWEVLINHKIKRYFSLVNDSDEFHKISLNFSRTFRMFILSTSTSRASRLTAKISVLDSACVLSRSHSRETEKQSKAEKDHFEVAIWPQSKSEETREASHNWVIFHARHFIEQRCRKSFAHECEVDDEGKTFQFQFFISKSDSYHFSIGNLDISFMLRHAFYDWFVKFHSLRSS